MEDVKYETAIERRIGNAIISALLPENPREAWLSMTWHDIVCG